MNTDAGRISFIADMNTAPLQAGAQRSVMTLRGISAQAQTTGLSMDRSFAQAGAGISAGINRAAGEVKSAFDSIAKQAIGITALMSSGMFIKNLMDQSREFNKQMRIVSTISEDVTNNFEGYKNKVIALCKEIAVAPEEAAAALYQINSASFLAADGMTVLEAASKAAVAGVTTTAIAADTITTVLNAYSMGADQAEAVSDKLFTTVRLGKTTLAELGSSISYVAPIAANYKISIDEVLAAVAQLTKKGVSTQMAMTQISAAITAIGNAMGDEAFADGLLAAFDKVSAKAAGSNQALKDELGNIRAVRAAISLTGKNAEDTKIIMAELQKSAGATEDAFQKMNSTAGAELTKLRTNFLEAFSSFAEGATSMMSGMAKGLNSAFESGNMERTLSILKDLIITYGIYKALLIALTVAKRAYVYVMERAAVQQALAQAQGVSLTAMQGAQMVATNALTAAWNRLKVAMQSNWIGLTCAALAGLCMLIYKLSSAEDVSAKAAKALSEIRTEATKKIADQRTKIDLLVQAAKNEKLALDERHKAITKLNALIPNYNAQLDAETGAYRANTAALTDYIAQLTRKYELEGAKDKLAEIGKQKAEAQISLTAAKKLYDSAQSYAASGQANTYTTSYGMVGSTSTHALDNAQAKLEKAKNELEEIKIQEKAILDAYGVDLQKEAVNEPVTIEPTKTPAAQLSEEDAKAAQKVLEQRTKLGREATDLERENQRQQTEALADGIKKRLALLDLERDDTLTALHRKAEEWAKANKQANMPGANASTTKLPQGQNISGLTLQQAQAINTAVDNANQRRLQGIQDIQRAELASMQEYIAQYGTYEARRLAIAKEYAAKIAKADTEGERLRLSEEQKQKEGSLETEALTRNIDWQGLFSKFGTLFDNEARQSLEGLKAYAASAQFKSASLEDQQRVFDYIDQLTQHLSQGGLTDALREAGASVEQYRTALMNRQEAESKATAATAKYNQLLSQGNTLDSEAVKSAQAAMVTANQQLAEANAHVTTSLQNMNSAATTASAALNDVVGAIQGLGSGSLSGILQGAQSIANLFKNGPKDIAKDLANSLGKAVGGKVGGILGGELGGEIIKGVFQVLDLLKNGIENLVSSLIDTILGAVNGLLDTVLNGRIFTSLFSSLKSGVGSILDTVTFGGFTSWFSATGNSKWVKETTERLTRRNEILTKAIDTLTSQIKATGGRLAISSASDAIRYQSQYVSNQSDLLGAQMSYHAAHHSNNYYIDQALNGSDWAAIERTLGRGINHNAASLWGLSPEDLKKLTSLPEVWDKIANSGKYDKSQYLNDYLDLADSIQGITDKLNEALTQTTFDSLRDSFLSTLTDMSSTAEDFASSFETMLQRAMLNSRMSDLFDDQIKALYDLWAQYSRDTQGQLTQGMVDDLRQRQQAITDGMVDMRRQMMDTFGWDAQGTRTGASKGIAQASQDSVDELNGRLTAIQGLTAEIHANTRLLVTNTGLILQSVMNIDNETEGLGSRLQRVESDLHGLRTVMDDIAFKGVKIKV